jgi:hypothetical protein
LQPVKFCEEGALAARCNSPDLCGPANIACRRCNFKLLVSATKSVTVKALVIMGLMSALRSFTFTPAFYHSLLNGEEILVNFMKVWTLNTFMPSIYK